MRECVEDETIILAGNRMKQTDSENGNNKPVITTIKSRYEKAMQAIIA